MWLCEGKLKLKIAHFRLPSASQKRTCLSSLMSRGRLETRRCSHEQSSRERTSSCSPEPRRGRTVVIKVFLAKAIARSGTKLTFQREVYIEIFLETSESEI